MQLLILMSRVVVWLILPMDQIAIGQFMVESWIRRVL